MENPIAYLENECHAFKDFLLVVGLQIAKIFTSTEDITCTCTNLFCILVFYRFKGYFLH